jgi:hypothetical protein
MMQWLSFNCLEIETEEYYKPCLEGYYAELKRHMAEVQPEVDLATDYPYEFLLEDFAITTLMFWSVIGNDTILDLSKVSFFLRFAFCVLRLSHTSTFYFNAAQPSDAEGG